MVIHTSAITYRKCIPNSYNNFYFVAQTNNVIPESMTRYLGRYKLHNINVITSPNYRWPWRP